MKFLEWIATVITIIGAILTSTNYHPLNLYFLNAGSFLWFVWAVLEHRNSIALVNAVMLAIYLSGIFGLTFA